MTCIAYSFKKEAKVYIVFDSIQYNIDISALNTSQTFTEHSYSNKTIQTSNMFEQSVINKANPANFEITFPAIRDRDFKVLFDRALDYDTFDLYITTEQDVLRIRNCVISNAIFVIEKMRPLTMTVSGEASELIRLDTTTTIPGVAYERTSIMTYNRISDLSITLDVSTILSEYLNSITLELQNEIKWTPWTTINNALTAIDADSSMYPEKFTVSKRILSGTITQYLTDTNNTNLLEWSTNSAFHIEAGQQVSSDFYGFDLDLTNCSFTNRVNTGEVFTQSYDWRLLQNATNLSDIVTYITISPTDIFTSAFTPAFV